MSGAVNSSAPYSPPVCDMFNEIVQNLKFFMSFTGVTVMKLVS